MVQNAYILGVGMTKFIKPRGQVDYPEMGFEAGVKAMVDAGINYDDVDQGVACYAYGDSTCGQRVFYQFGLRAPISLHELFKLLQRVLANTASQE